MPKFAPVPLTKAGEEKFCLFLTVGMCVAGGKSNKTQPAQSKRVSKASLIQNTAEKSVFSSRSLITCSPALPPLSSSENMGTVPRGRSLPQPQPPSGYSRARCLPLQTSIFVISFALLQKLGGNPIKTSGKPIPSPLENHLCEPPEELSYTITAVFPLLE